MQHLLGFCGSELRQMSNVSDHLPCVLISISRFPECRHTGPPNAVLDYPIKFPVRHLLRFLRAKVGRPWRHDAVELGITTAILGMAGCTVFLIVTSGLDDVDLVLGKWAAHLLVLCRDGTVESLHGDARFHIRWLGAGPKALAP